MTNPTFVKPPLGLLVERHQVGDGRGGLDKVRVLVFEVGNQHPELGAPVAHVVQPKHVVSQKLQKPGHGFTDNCRPYKSSEIIFNDRQRVFWQDILIITKILFSFVNGNRMAVKNLPQMADMHFFGYVWT